MPRNTDNLRCIKIASNGSVEEISHSQYDEETADRLYSGSALMLTEYWETDNYKLTMTMPYLFAPEDDVNIIATMLFRKLRSRHGVPCLNVVCGTAYLVNESDTEIIDFTMQDFLFVRNRVFQMVW